MFRRLTPGDPLKLPRALLGALLGVTFALWRLASMGALGTISGGREGHTTVPAQLTAGAWQTVAVLVALGAVVGFFLGWRTPRRRRVYTD